jgi:Ras-related protein Rab-5C/Ras-related protein Rab-22
MPHPHPHHHHHYRDHGPPLPHTQDVDTDRAHAYADEIDALFLETSAKTNRNVQGLFEGISRKLPAAQEPAFSGEIADLREPGKGSKASGGAGGGKSGGGGCC